MGERFGVYGSRRPPPELTKRCCGSAMSFVVRTRGTLSPRKTMCSQDDSGCEARAQFHEMMMLNPIHFSKRQGLYPAVKRSRTAKDDLRLYRAIRKSCLLHYGAVLSNDDRMMLHAGQPDVVCQSCANIASARTGERDFDDNGRVVTRVSVPASGFPHRSRTLGSKVVSSSMGTDIPSAKTSHARPGASTAKLLDGGTSTAARSFP